VLTASSSASCGVEFVRGQTVLVFARYGGTVTVEATADQLTASLCDGTRSVEAEPVALASSGYAPVAAFGEPDDDDAGFPLLGWLSYVAVAGLGAMPIVLWIRFQRQSRAR
jgi:hypothetical protein